MHLLFAHQQYSKNAAVSLQSKWHTGKLVIMNNKTKTVIKFNLQPPIYIHATHTHNQLIRLIERPHQVP